MSKETLVANHVLKMIEWIEKLKGLGIILEDELCVDLILQSLPNSFSQFIINFNMNKIDVTLPELLNMLKNAEGTMKKERPVLFVAENYKKRKKSFKKGQGKNKRTKKAKVVKKKESVKAKRQCFHCSKDGHWKKSCKTFLAEKAKMKLEEALGLFMINLCFFSKHR